MIRIECVFDGHQEADGISANVAPMEDAVMVIQAYSTHICMVSVSVSEVFK